jgi:hypothetical protein
MNFNLLYYRLHATEKILVMINEAVTLVQQQLIEHALDHIKVLRRFRMLKQLSQYQAQIIGKIPNLQSDDPNDFDNFLETVRNEINTIINPNS